MRRAVGRGRRGPGLVGTAARTAVIAGTATAVSGRVAASQAVRQAPAGPAPGAPPEHGGPPAQGSPPQVQAPAAPPSVDQLHEALTKLGALRDAGLLTEEEFAAQKRLLLAP